MTAGVLDITSFDKSQVYIQEQEGGDPVVAGCEAGPTRVFPVPGLDISVSRHHL